MTRKAPKEFQCERCGKLFLSYDYRNNRTPRYCSRACGQPNRYARQTITCSVCGKEFDRKRYHVEMSGTRGQFCGFECYARWQAEHTTGPANPGYNPSAHEILTCDWCGKEFERPKYVRGGQLHFCCRDCFHAFAGEHFRRQRPTSYGKSWRRARAQAMDRDQHRCQDCGSESLLVVHHIEPYKSFENGQDAHELDNLVTLCRACHLARHNPSLVSFR